jgi:hypothetical protein
VSNISSIRSRKASSADPGRDRLRSAIAAQAAAADAVARHHDAIMKMVASRNAAKKEAATAAGEIDVALAGHAEAIARAAAAGSAAPTTSAVRATRNRHQDMVDQAEALAAALDKLKAELPELKRAEVLASRDVEVAVCAVFEAPAREMLDRALALRRELDPLVSTLAALFASDIGQHAGEFGRMDVRGDALDQISKALAPLFGAPNVPRDGEPWRSARARLLESPDAPLDELDVRKVQDSRNVDAAGVS